MHWLDSWQQAATYVQLKLIEQQHGKDEAVTRPYSDTHKLKVNTCCPWTFHQAPQSWCLDNYREDVDAWSSLLTNQPCPTPTHSHHRHCCNVICDANVLTTVSMVTSMQAFIQRTYQWEPLTWRMCQYCVNKSVSTERPKTASVTFGFQTESGRLWNVVGRAKKKAQRPNMPSWCCGICRAKIAVPSRKKHLKGWKNMHVCDNMQPL